MDSQQIKLIVEGALLAGGRALSLQELGNLFDANGRPSNAQFREALAQVNEDCEGRAFELREVGSGFRFQVREQFGTWVSRLWEEKPARYTRALLETMALVAYRQPITRAEIEEVRGVAVSTNIIKTLLERSWVKVVGHRDTPGKPAMYATTREFLDYFNLKTLGELPSLADIREITSLNQELELEAAMTIGLGSSDAGTDVKEAGTDAANEPENELKNENENENENDIDTDAVNEDADEVLAKVDVNATISEAESEAGEAAMDNEVLETANTATNVTADRPAEIDESEVEAFDEDTADSQLLACSQSHS